MKNIIIVEGVDRVGKTTLVNKLVDELGYSKFIPLNIIPEVRSMEMETEKIFATLSALVLLKNDKIVIDRFHLSEYVYGLNDRGYINKDCAKADAILSRLNSLLVYVRPTNIHQSSKEHGKDLFEHNKLFELLFNKTKMDKLSCTYKSIDETIQRIKEK